MLNTLLQLLIVFYFVIFPFGQLDRIELPFITVHITDVIIGLIAGIFLIKSLFSRIDKTYLGFYLLSFMAIAILSYFANISQVTSQEATRGFLYLSRFVSYILFFFALVNLRKNDDKFFTKTLFTVGFLITTFALIQYLLMPDTRALFHFGWDNHYFRSVGTFLDPSFLGILLVFFILFIFVKVEDSKISRLALLLSVAALVLTFSRSSYLALFFGLLAINIKSIKLSKTFLVAITFAIALLFAPRPGGEGVNLARTSTINYRLLNYEMSLEQAVKKPLLGYGYNLVNWEDKNSGLENHAKFGVDSSLLFILLTTGIIGLLIFASLIWHILIKSFKSNKETSILVFGSFVAILVHSIFQNSLFYPWVLGWLLTLLALMEKEVEG
jgi:O-antigen ligase